MTKRIFLILLVIFVFAAKSQAQFSLAVKGSSGINTNNETDPWSLNTPWPANASQTIASGTPFCTQSTISTFSSLLNWEAGNRLSLGLFYQYTTLQSSATLRKTSGQSVGIQTRFNFARNTKNFIPFIQASYLFLNSLSLHQDKVTSTTQPGQTQPGFNISFVTGIGVALEVGAEVKLSRSFSLLVDGGIRGISLSSGSGNSDLTKQNYGGFYGPRTFEGIFWKQGSLGLKYYFGKSTRKRDF